MGWWPWQRRTDAASPVAGRGAAAGPAPSARPAPVGWAFLPPIQRTTSGIALVSEPEAFARQLPVWADPRLTGPMVHLVDARAPSGLVAGDGRGVGAPAAEDLGPDMPLAPARPPAVTDWRRVQRTASVAGSLVTAPLPPLPTRSVDAFPADAASTRPQGPDNPPPGAADLPLRPEAHQALPAGQPSVPQDRDGAGGPVRPEAEAPATAQRDVTTAGPPTAGSPSAGSPSAGPLSAGDDGEPFSASVRGAGVQGSAGPDDAVEPVGTTAPPGPVVVARAATTSAVPSADRPVLVDHPAPAAPDDRHAALHLSASDVRSTRAVPPPAVPGTTASAGPPARHRAGLGAPLPGPAPVGTPPVGTPPVGPAPVVHRSADPRHGGPAGSPSSGSSPPLATPEPSGTGAAPWEVGATFVPIGPSPARPGPGRTPSDAGPSPAAPPPPTAPALVRRAGGIGRPVQRSAAAPAATQPADSPRPGDDRGAGDGADDAVLRSGGGSGTHVVSAHGADESPTTELPVARSVSSTGALPSHGDARSGPGDVDVPGGEAGPGPWPPPGVAVPAEVVVPAAGPRPPVRGVVDPPVPASDERTSPSRAVGAGPVPGPAAPSTSTVGLQRSVSVPPPRPPAAPSRWSAAPPDPHGASPHLLRASPHPPRASSDPPPVSSVPVAATVSAERRPGWPDAVDVRETTVTATAQRSLPVVGRGRADLPHAPVARTVQRTTARSATAAPLVLAPAPTRASDPDPVSADPTPAPDAVMVQRTEAPGEAAAATGPGSGASSSGAPASNASASVVPASAASPGAPTGVDVDELVRRLIGPLLRRIRAELLLDRERRGIRTDAG